MRHFKLVNNSGVELDITTTSVLFHEISGLGFEEDNDFRQIGDFWALNRSNRSQAVVSGNVIFTDSPNETLGDTPYEKYRWFADFISSVPLTLKYNPYGPIVEPKEDGEKESYFRRTVRVSKIEKSEYNEYGVLDCGIDFVCYTPWFSAFNKTLEIVVPEQEEEYGWVWGSGDRTEASNGQWTFNASETPLTFGTGDRTQAANGSWTFVESEQIEGTTLPKFRYEAPNGFSGEDLVVDSDCPIKLTVYGPMQNPSWTHSVITYDTNGDQVETVISTGGFSSSANVSFNTEDDKLVVDGTSGNYRIYRINANGTTSDLYSVRDFGTPCFITLKKGENRISIVSSNGDIAKRIEIEGHIYHATV